MFNANFEVALSVRGKLCIINHRSKRLDENDDPVLDNNDKVIYDSVEIPTLFTLSWKSDVEKTDQGYTKSKTKSAIGKFRKSMAPYLLKKNTVTFTDPETSMAFNFTISHVITHESHIEVLLS